MIWHTFDTKRNNTREKLCTFSKIDDFSTLDLRTFFSIEAEINERKEKETHENVSEKKIGNLIIMSNEKKVYLNENLIYWKKCYRLTFK